MYARHTLMSIPTDHHRGEPLRRGARIVVHPWERVVVVRRGAIVEVLTPGAHRRWASGLRGRRIDVRPWVLHVPVQEVPTADGVTVKVSLAAEARVIDAEAFVVAGPSVHERLYLRAQMALRDVVATASVEDVVTGRATVGTRLAEAVGDVSDLGVALERVEVKDVVLPSELKRAQAEVLLARAQGLAALERSRAEAASLRTLANAARLAADLPALVELRLVQELGRSSGHTVVIGQSLRA
jgi:regulator of protease activity HflC (stomatin/prohibitin superfamily)